MSKTLDVYLSFSSPFAYLANTQLTALAKRTQCNINYHVIDLYKVMQLSGNPGPKDVPAKIKYIVKDIFDWCKYYGVTINVPSRLAIDSTPGAAAALAAKDGRKLPEFIDRVMRAYFVEDLDIADAQVLGKLGAEVGLDSEVVAAAVTDPAILDRVAADAEAAVKRGVFGVPAFFIDDDMYWGNDRLMFVEQALKS